MHVTGGSGGRVAGKAHGLRVLAGELLPSRRCYGTAPGHGQPGFARRRRSSDAGVPGRAVAASPLLVHRTPGIGCDAQTLTRLRQLAPCWAASRIADQESQPKYRAITPNVSMNPWAKMLVHSTCPDKRYAPPRISPATPESRMPDGPCSSGRSRTTARSPQAPPARPGSIAGRGRRRASSGSRGN